MIRSKTELREFLDQDKLALGIETNLFYNLRNLIIPNHIYNFQRRMRLTSYYKHQAGFFNKILYGWHKFWYRKQSLKLGFSIPEDVFGPGLAIVHYGTIVVNMNAKIGANCRIHACTNIGASGGSSKAPQLGNNIYIGPGAKIYGEINIADNCAIGANATVFKTIDQKSVMIAGNPGKVIKEIDITKIIKHVS